MTFLSPLPSKTAVNKAGVVLATKAKGDAGYREAFELVANWRKCLAIPLQRLNMQVRNRLDRIGYGGFLVAQRLKRMKSIVSKLRRNPKMQMARMQDIGGLRVVLDSVSDVETFGALMKDQERTSFAFVSSSDYIAKPKPSGYRCLHETFRFENEDYPESNGRIVEMQIRTGLQHLWATAVESLDVLMKAAFKTGQTNAPHAEYVKLASALFSLEEGRPVLEEFQNIPAPELVRRINEQGKIFDTYLQKHVPESLIIGRPGIDEAYSLLSLDMNKGKPRVSIQAFFADEEERAVQAYTREEEDTEDNTDRLVVLVCAGGSMFSLEKAYPNYFLNLDDFKSELKRICAKFK